MRNALFLLGLVAMTWATAATPVDAQTQAGKMKGQYAPVNGLKMYYEIHGPANGTPLVLLHGGGSTIQTSFGVILPLLAKNRQVIAFEQQGHGHTADIADRPFSFEHSADDAAELLRYLKVKKADFLGFSNGGTIAVQIAIRHPELVQKLIIASANINRNGMYPEFWESMKKTSLQEMPAELREAYLKTAPNPDQLQSFFDKSVKRMLEFKDIPPDAIRSIIVPAFVINGDQDVVRPEHAVEIYRLLPHSRLAIMPAGHGTYFGEVSAVKNSSKLPELTAAIIEEFLNGQGDGKGDK